MSKLEDKFWQFHNTNPHFYNVLVRLCRAWRRSHSGQLGIAMLFELARRDETVVVMHGRDFKLNNNHRAYYARVIMKNEVDLLGLFKLRQQRIQSTIGPDNSTLESGEHQA